MSEEASDHCYRNDGFYIINDCDKLKVTQQMAIWVFLLSFKDTTLISIRTGHLDRGGPTFAQHTQHNSRLRYHCATKAVIYTNTH